MHISDLAPFSLLVLPVLSPEQDITHKDASKQKQRRVRLRRKKSGVVDGSPRDGPSTAKSTRSKTPQSGHETAVAKRRSSTLEASRPRTTSNSTSTALDGVPSSRVARSSGSATDMEADPGRLKVLSRSVGSACLVLRDCTILRSTPCRTKKGGTRLRGMDSSSQLFYLGRINQEAQFLQARSGGATEMQSFLPPAGETRAEKRQIW